MPFSLLPTGVPVSKRLFDLLISVPLLALLLPVLGLLAVIVRFAHGSPVIFRQPRPGLNGRPFTLMKFRTMAEAHDESGQPLSDSKRITRLGLFLRATSLDELPELFNVLKGEMSLVGPRPLLLRYLSRYTPEQNRRHEVLPGITGWAQVNGRNALTWEVKFRLDVWYVDHWSLGLDLQILGMTFIKALLREGISQAGFVSSEEFTGTDIDDNIHDSLHR